MKSFRGFIVLLLPFFCSIMVHAQKEYNGVMTGTDQSPWHGHGNSNNYNNNARKPVCKTCMGMKLCRNCNGSKLVANPYTRRNEFCEVCNRTGKCPTCNGTGESPFRR